MGRLSSSRGGPGGHSGPCGCRAWPPVLPSGHTVLPQHDGSESYLRPPGPSPSPSQVSNSRDRLSASSDHSGYCWVASSLPFRPDHRHVPQHSPAQRAHICPHRCPRTRGQGLLHTSAQSWETHSGTRHGCILSQSGRGGFMHRTGCTHTDLPKSTQTGQNQAPLHQGGGRDPPPAPSSPTALTLPQPFPPSPGRFLQGLPRCPSLPFPSCLLKTKIHADQVEQPAMGPLP